MRSDCGAPLAGVRVLDFTRLLPGPVCTLHLADLGADVIKIEDTGSGDYARSIGARASEPSAFYRNVNRGKRSLAVDLKAARGRDCLLALLPDCDVVVESFRPGVMASLGLDHASLATRFPRIVYASISGYGQTGPRAAMAGHDINYLGYAGVLEQTGIAGGPPALCNLQIADLLGGAATTAIAILAALLGVARNGHGSYLDISMADAVLSQQHFALQALTLHGGRTLPRGDDLLSGGVPCYGVYATQDGRHVAVGALENKFWRRLCTELGRDDLAPHALATGSEGARTRAELAAIFATHPLSYWTAHFDGIDCCVTPVATLDEALCDPQFRAREMVGTRDDGSHTLAPPWATADNASFAAREAPRQGQHGREILTAAGYDGRAIDRLIEAGIVKIASA